MDAIVRQLLHIVMVLTGMVTTVVVGAAVVADNDTLSQQKKNQAQTQANTQTSTQTQNAMQSPQSPTPPGVVQLQNTQKSQTNTINATQVRVRADQESSVSQAITE